MHITVSGHRGCTRIPFLKLDIVIKLHYSTQPSLTQPNHASSVFLDSADFGGGRSCRVSKGTSNADDAKAMAMDCKRRHVAATLIIVDKMHATPWQREKLFSTRFVSNRP